MRTSPFFRFVPVAFIAITSVSIAYATSVARAEEPVACTMDAKLCPDGETYVGRQGPNCEFAPCPGETQACSRDAKICPDGVTAVGREGPNCEFAACPTTYTVTCAPGVVCEKTTPECKPYQCADGTQAPRCDADGNRLSYYDAPCITHGGEMPGYVLNDVPPTRADAEAITYVKKEGIVEGYADGSYKPDNAINRAEFVKILMGVFDDDGRMCKMQGFPDVSLSEWYGISAHKALCSGIIDGYADGTFRPATNINFAEAAKILTKSFGLEASMTIPACEDSDPNECPWFRSYVLMLEMKAAIPTSIKRFDQNITRGEMAEMIFRLETDNNDKQTQTFDFLQFMAYCDRRIAAGHASCE